MRYIFSKEQSISLVYQDGNQGDWDIKINDAKIEAEISSLDVKNRFQNKHIKDTQHCDYICFIGVVPNALYMRLEKIKRD